MKWQECAYGKLGPWEPPPCEGCSKRNRLSSGSPTCCRP